VELWKSNGTSSGTLLVKDINPGFGDSYAVFLTNVSGTLFFRANDGSHGYELWKSKGSDTNTTLVNDIRPGSDSSYPRHLTNVSGTLFFSANHGSYGVELWQSNGTSSGTVLVEINTSSDGSSPSSLTNVSGHLFFSANDGTYGTELWDPLVVGTAPAGSTSGAVPTSPAPPAGSVGSGPSTPTSPPGAPWWQRALWLEALLLVDDPGAAAEGVAWLALLRALPGDESPLALDLLLAGLASGDTGWAPPAPPRRGARG